ncbi:hypothetical protein ACOMHN_011879 [Nucella lapillus]
MDIHKRQKVTFVAVLAAAAIIFGILHLPSLQIGQLSYLPSASLRDNPPQVRNETMEMWATFARRRDRVRQECQTPPQVYYRHNPKTTPDRFLVDDRHRLLYCYIPKNGCSFWKRVFSVLDGSNSGRSVFNISGTAIHRAQSAFSTLAQGSGSFLAVHHLFQASRKILFVRDPLHRLFSGYVDKFFSPCSFASLEAGVFRNCFNVTKNNSSCTRGLNFTEFLLYVTNDRGYPVNEHFLRQHSLCFPCHVDYDFVGKLESFQRDVEFILKEVVGVNPTEVFGPEEDFEERSDVNIMTDIVHRTWRLCRKERCVTPYGKMLRLWIAFQVRGFLSVQQRFPLSRDMAHKATMPHFLDLVLQAYRRSGRRALVKQQRELAVQEAFRGVPESVMVRVEGLVREDCRLFGYDCDVRARFRVNSPSPPRPLFHMHEALLV